MNVGSAYLTIYPSMQGFASDISAAFGKEGAAAGKSFANGVEKGTAAMASQVGGNVQATADAVVRAELKVKTVREQQETANNRLKIAEQQLVETKKKYADGSSQVLQAEERVRQARIKAENATDNLKSAEEELAHKQKVVKESAEQAAQALTTMKTSTHGLSSAISGAIGGLVATLAQQSIQMIRNLSHEMIEASDSAKKFEATLNFAGLDTFAIDAATKATQRYADETVYDLAEVRNATAQLAANGIANYLELVEAAGNLNAVAGGTAETFGSVTLAMTQTAGAGKLTTENWNQFINAMPGASEKLVQIMRDTNAFEGNFRDAMARGEISADEFFNAIQKLGMTDVAREAARSTDQISNAMGVVKASVVGIGSSLITAFSPLITGAMTGVSAVLDGIGAGLDYVISSVQQFATSGRFTFAFASAMEKAHSCVASLQTAFAAFKPSLEAFANALLPSLTLGINTLINVAGVLFEAIAQASVFIAPIIQSVMSFATSIGSTLVPAFNAILAVIQFVMPAIQNIIVFAAQEILKCWNTFIMPLAPICQAVFNVISITVQTVMSAIRTVISAVTAIINGDWSTAWNEIKAFFVGTWDNLKSVATDGVLKVMTAIEELPDKIKTFFSNAKSWLVDSGKALIDGFVQGIKNSISNVTDAVSSVVSKAREFFPFSPAKRGAFSGHGYTTYSGAALVGDFAKSITANSSKAVVAVGSMMSAVNGVIAHDPFAARAQFSATGGGAGAPRTLNIQNINIEARSLDDINSIEQFSSRVFDLALTM